MKINEIHSTVKAAVQAGLGDDWDVRIERQEDGVTLVSGLMATAIQFRLEPDVQTEELLAVATAEMVARLRVDLTRMLAERLEEPASNLSRPPRTSAWRTVRPTRPARPRPRAWTSSPR